MGALTKLKGGTLYGDHSLEFMAQIVDFVARGAGAGPHGP